MISFSQVGRGRNGREVRMGGKNQGREKEEGWVGCQGRSPTGQQFQGHLQGSKDDSDCAWEHKVLLFRILERLHALHPAENTYVSLTSDSLYTSLQVCSIALWTINNYQN